MDLLPNTTNANAEDLPSDLGNTAKPRLRLYSSELNPLRALVVLQLSSFLVWAYVAAIAVWVPSNLPHRFEGTLPIRTDTAGVLAFSSSLVFATVVTVLSSWAAPAHRLRRFVFTLCLNAGLYCWSGWLYISCNSITHPYTLHMPLTHLASWPDEGTFATTCMLLGTAFLAGSALVFIQRRPHGVA